MAEKCPYCGEDLENGILWHRGGLFVPDGEKIPHILSEKAIKKRSFLAPLYIHFFNFNQHFFIH